MTDDAMGRAQFFRYIASKTASAALHFAEELLTPAHHAEEMIEAALAAPLIPTEEYTDEPKLLTSSNPPLYILGDIEHNLIAVPAMCERDGFLFTYLPHKDALYCSACQKKHMLTRINGCIDIDLPVHPLIVKDGFIYLPK